MRYGLYDNLVSWGRSAEHVHWREKRKKQTGTRQQEQESDDSKLNISNLKTDCGDPSCLNQLLG